MGCNCLKPKNIKDKIKHIKNVITRDVKEIWDESKDELIVSSGESFKIKK